MSQITRIALIGYGEAGRIFANTFAAIPAFRVAAFDILVAQKEAYAEMRKLADEADVSLCTSMEQAVADADVVISAVTATSAFTVAQRAADLLKAGQFFVDINSVSPGVKQTSHGLCAAKGIRYVEAAVMASVPPYGVKVPMLLGGPDAEGFIALMQPAGMQMKWHAKEVGRASAIKMCRSIMIKGIEALTVESMLTARHYGVEDEVLASLDETFPSMDWQKQADYLVSRVVQHGRRRAAEMREVAHTIRDANLEPMMACATADRQDWLADLVGGGKIEKKEKSWRKVADAIRWRRD
jgi:3-hydroxyisobutyrate dehydrogenase-like beta-hydroxyacid dehydrogenase